MSRVPGSGAAFGQTETSDTKVVTGNYRVALPDGRTQIVTYTADPYGPGGYVADVKYDGAAQYPDATLYNPAPSYHPAPVVKAAAAPPAPAPEAKAAPAAEAPAAKEADRSSFRASPQPLQPAPSVRKFSFRVLPAADEAAA